MEIIHLSAECYPVAKVGGLGDVVGALPKYQQKLGHIAKVVLPAYNTKFLHQHQFEVCYDAWATLGFNNFQFRVLKEVNNILGFDLYLIHIADLLDRPNVYGYNDDTERFLAYQIATLDWMSQWEHQPDVIHCHDHHTGLVPFMVANCHKYAALSNVKTVLTIHNAQYQGQFGWDKLFYIPPFDLWKSGLLDWNGLINPLAAAIKCVWQLTTVSHSYLDEISIQANGLESLFRDERNKSVGILNGIDTVVWNPQKDPMVFKKYQTRTVAAGKQANKEELCRLFNLDPSKPLFTFIGRLVGEKGADLLPDIFYNIIQQSGQGLNILVLGSGDSQVEHRLSQLTEMFPGTYNAYIGYNEQLSHLIYAGADFLFMPSRVEPCGLNQMYALRYGTIPIVRRVGGLKDTVIDIGDGGFGICHDQTSISDVCYAAERAFTLYQEKNKMKEIRKFIMQLDHSWDKAAQEYIAIYQN